jgi:Fe-S-cluster containining protein
LFDALSRACSECSIHGGCCFEARPPLCQERIDILQENGVRSEDIEFAGYKRLKLKPDGFCVMFEEGKCKIHGIKPETCVAGPFTFDVKGSILEIFLKRESICPMVALLKQNRDLYEELFDLAAEKIVNLVTALPPAELEEICKIDEPETDLVAEIALKG